MKMNWWIVLSLVLVFMVGAGAWEIVRPKPVPPKPVEIPVQINLDSARAEWIRPVVQELNLTEEEFGKAVAASELLKKENRGLLDSLIAMSHHPARAYSIDTSFATNVLATYLDEDGLTEQQAHRTTMRIRSSFLGHPYNVFREISGKVEPITVKVKTKERIIRQEIEARTYGFWTQFGIGVGDPAGILGQIGYGSIGLGFYAPIGSRVGYLLTVQTSL